MHWLKTFAIVSTKHKYNTFNFNRMFFEKHHQKRCFELYIFPATYIKCLSNIVCWYKSQKMTNLFCDTWISVESLMNTHSNWFHRFFPNYRNSDLMCFGMVLNFARLAQFISNNKDVLKYRLEKNWISQILLSFQWNHSNVEVLDLIQFKKNVNGHGINLHIRKMSSWDS